MNNVLKYLMRIVRFSHISVFYVLTQDLVFLINAVKSKNDNSDVTYNLLHKLIRESKEC